jgi:membrane-associated phospholipid phosphatase
MRKTLLILLYLFAIKTYAQKDSSFYNKQYNYKSYIVPAIFVAYGISNYGNNGYPGSIAIKNFRNDNFISFYSSADDYIAFAPGLLMLSLDLFHVKSKSDFANQAAITGKSVLISLALVTILKYSTQVLRPDGTAQNSFPSGHTAFAFTLAEVLHQEFKHKAFVFITGYTLATTVGAMRLLNNRHWFTDVMVGVGIGMATTKFIYATHKYKWKMNNKGFLPIIGDKQVGFVFNF